MGSRARRVRDLVLDVEPEPIAEVAQGLAVVNAGGWGIFRVGYETAHRTALAEQLSELTPLERANLLADTWATTLAGLSTLEEFLVLAARLGDETEPAAWSPVGNAFALTKRITLAEQEEALHQAVRALHGAHAPPTGLRRSSG